GDLVGANGDLLYLRHGNLLSGLYYQSGALLPVAGIAIAGTIEDIAQDAQRLAVLTDSGLTLIELAGDKVPRLQAVGDLPLSGQSRISLHGAQLLSWNESGEATLRQLDWSGAVSATTIGTLVTGGAIERVDWDGELAWLTVADAGGSRHWQQWRDGVRMGSLSVDADEIRFTAGKLYRLRNSNQGGAIESQAIGVTGNASSLVPEAHRLPFGLLVAARDLFHHHRRRAAAGRTDRLPGWARHLSLEQPAPGRGLVSARIRAAERAGDASARSHRQC
ncbi:MAG: hypothetical protein P8178_19045, partial [Candidatus Thiodiazotropha sp.]